jgi:S1-C subfamily serine protease
MAKLSKEVRDVVVVFSVILLLVIGGFAFSLYKMQEDYTKKILIMNKNLIENLNSVRDELEEDIFWLRTNLTLKLNLVENNLKNFREQNKKELATLNSLIEQIEDQSDIKLQELKEEVSSIQVKSSDFSTIVDDVLQSVVSVGTDQGIGSGAIIDEEGFIVTNHHVVHGANIIRVLTYSGKVHDASLIGYDPDVDIAVLKISADGLKRLRFGDSDDTRVGEKVIALGSPAGLSFTVTEGIVSAVNRKGPNNLPIYTQIDVPINPGNSGGPLVNSRGQIIGINNYKVGGYEGLGFAIQSNVVKNVTQQIIQHYLQNP